MKKIAINGFGRIGRLLFRKLHGRPDFKIVAVNDLGDLENLAYLLAHDSVYGNYDKMVLTEGGKLSVAGEEVSFLSVKDPAELPWAELGVDIVIESTGAFESFAAAGAHIQAGAKHVVLSAPAKDADGELGQTFLVGAGELRKGCQITSNGSCTTNAASPIIKILAETVGIEKAILSTVHAYTATQSIVDSPVKGKDFRRGRAGAQNIVPSTTGAAVAVTRVMPELTDKFDGVAFRVPVVAGSLADITLITKRPTSEEEINNLLEAAAKEKRWQGIFTTTREQYVSSDIVGKEYGAIADLSFTKVVDGNLVKVISWYDNEAGYVNTLIKHLEFLI
jgi:glyceraldehyde 3-phosphate dehydrogenase